MPTPELPPLPDIHAVLREYGTSTGCADVIASLMREYALLARRPLEHCQCDACRPTLHASCCAVHNEPAMPKGPCDCGAALAAREPLTNAAADVLAERHLWQWDEEWFKPKDQRRNLVRAAAMILAEIERLDRASGITEPKEA